jgi:hypothetical protein
LPSCLPQVVADVPPQALDVEVYSLPKVEDAYLAPEVLLHIAYEVVSQLDRVEGFQLLSLKEQSLRGFVGEQICSLQLVAAAGPSHAFEDDECSMPDEEDEDLAPVGDHDELTLEVLLHVAYEVVSQLDRAEVFRSLSIEELSLRDFLVEQIRSLRLVIEEQDDLAPSLAQEATALAHDSRHDQEYIVVASVGCYPSTVGHSSHAPLLGNGGQVVVLSNRSYDRAVVLSPPRLWLKPSWDACCSFGAGIPLLPPQDSVALSGRESGGVAQVVARSSLYSKLCMKVVKSVKVKPPEAALLVLLSFHFVLRRLRRFALQAAQHIRGSTLSSKSLCRSPRKSEGLRLESSPFSLVVGRAVFCELFLLATRVASMELLFRRELLPG